MSEQGETATPQEGTATPPEAPATSTASEPPEWLSQIQERMDQQGAQMQQLVDGLYQPVEEEEDDSQQRLSDDELYDDDGDYTPEGARQVVSELIAEQLNAAMSKRDTDEAYQLRELAFEDLRERTPALKDDKYAAQLANAAADWAEAAGVPGLVGRPEFVDLIEHMHKSGQFDERAASETSETERDVVLEPGSGSSASRQKQPEIDWGERIVKAAERLRPSI